MPYIHPAVRKALRLPPRILDQRAATPGDLNYILTMEVQEYIKDKGSKYRTYNDVIGVLECMKLELYRRMVAPYEDVKCRQNGDVYENTKGQESEQQDGSAGCG